MQVTPKNFDIFAKGLVPLKPRIDPAALQTAKEWYKTFAGAHAVKMEDADLIEIYADLH
ncbi:hypothetical protein KA005_54360 [bacterium]|nr:hypothetical protein [bacterium]